MPGMSWICPFCPQICAFACGDLHPHLMHGSLVHPSPYHKRYVDRFIRFTALTIVTDRQTDTPRYSVSVTPSVAKGRI